LKLSRKRKLRKRTESSIKPLEILHRRKDMRKKEIMLRLLMSLKLILGLEKN